MAFEYIDHRLLKRTDASSGIISMSRTRIIALAILLTLTLASPAPAQSEQGGAGGDRTQELVDQLKEVIRDAEQNRRSNPRTTKQLRELVQGYDYP